MLMIIILMTIRYKLNVADFETDPRLNLRILLKKTNRRSKMSLIFLFIFTKELDIAVMKLSVTYLWYPGHSQIIDSFISIPTHIVYRKVDIMLGVATELSWTFQGYCSKLHGYSNVRIIMIITTTNTWENITNRKVYQITKCLLLRSKGVASHSEHRVICGITGRACDTHESAGSSPYEI